MLNLSHGIDSLTNFKRQTAEYIQRLRETGEPVVLTVNGKAELVVQDADSYQKLVAAAARADREETVAAIRAGLADVAGGRTKPRARHSGRSPRSTASKFQADSVKYRVRITAKAEGDVENALSWFQEQNAPAAGRHWFAQLMARIATLETRPERCAFAEESEDVGVAVRELLFGKRQGTYRILFQISDPTARCIFCESGTQPGTRL